MAEIDAIYEESHEIYGAPKIAAKMRQKGNNVSGRTVGKYMREMGIRACYRKHKTRTTKDCDFSSGLKNRLNRDFRPERPDAAWCTDITYLWTCEGFVYPASIMNLYSRKIISWTLGKRWRRSGYWSRRKGEGAAATYDLIYNAAQFAKRGFGYVIALDRLINTTGESSLCFRPLSPALEAGLCIVWKKYQVLSRASSVFL